MIVITHKANLKKSTFKLELKRSQKPKINITFLFVSVLNEGQKVKTKTLPDKTIATITNIHCKNATLINHNIEIGI